VGGTTIGPGLVGQAFVFHANGDAVRIGNPANLRLQYITIEGWIKRSSASQVSANASSDGLAFGYGTGGYGFGLAHGTGQLLLSQIGQSAVYSASGITDLNFHHIAVTASNGNAAFYVDGVAITSTAYNPVYSFTTQAAIGAQGDNLAAGFLGTIDELSIYNRALTAGEIQLIYSAATLGKCATPVAPSIVQQPTNQTVLAGLTVTMSVSATGTRPLFYQWQFNGTNLAAATNSALALTNVLVAQAGNYSVTVSNAGGAILSSNALLTVVSPTYNLGILNQGPGTFELSFSGVPGVVYRIQWSPVLPPTNWQDLVIRTADAYGIFIYTDQPPTNSPSRYYRAVSP
jgi:hypothetical protein